MDIITYFKQTTPYPSVSTYRDHTKGRRRRHAASTQLRQTRISFHRIEPQHDGFVRLCALVAVAFRFQLQLQLLDGSLNHRCGCWAVGLVVCRILVIHWRSVVTVAIGVVLEEGVARSKLGCSVLGYCRRRIGVFNRLWRWLGNVCLSFWCRGRLDIFVDVLVYCGRRIGFAVGCGFYTITNKLYFICTEYI